MDESGYPSVYVVDSHVTRPSLPPRLSERPQRAGVTQTLLFLLVSLALCGMVIEACFIYRLHQHESGSSASPSKLIAGEDVAAPTKRPSLVTPSKPVAHLTDGQHIVHGKKIMAWSMAAEPLLYKMYYKDQCLVIQKEGFYYVYSKVSFRDSNIFHHSIELNTTLYSGKSITLLLSRKYSEGSSSKRSNSYLGGVFHLQESDAIFVKVSDTSKIERHKAYENIFGAYMI
ncbi:tumor necrosis factor ligand superfamily member 14 [Morone saxatilis]|uniref:tumor necrosis factor ligand superfamily member 14 n=1 Tax=Morone saxatilis TaxID=34816 RepID=UPI0015E1EA4E|nr:tumor necrosis factor ligand superfamily member 14 [Morone saxatilis]